jgi:Tol biopolymer transport system component
MPLSIKPIGRAARFFLLLALAACAPAPVPPTELPPTPTVLATFAPAPTPTHEPASAPPIGHVAFSVFINEAEAQNLYLIEAGGGNRRPLTGGPGHDYDPSFSPDGTQLVFRSDRDGYDVLYVINVDGDGLRKLSDHPGEEQRSPAWSPDGAWIAYAAFEPDVSAPNIYMVRPDGSDRRQLTNGEFPAFYEYPSWSPDSTQLVYHFHLGYGAKQIGRVNVDGSGQTVITEGPTDNDYPVWSPDGTRIAFKSERDGNREIYVMQADGRGQSNLTQAPDAEDTFPVWSPDGEWIAFSSERTAGSGVYLIRADGSGLTFLTEGAMPGWGP